MSSPSEAPAKRQKRDSDAPYELLYWPGIPGRGEHVRLALEEAGAEYSEGSVEDVLALINADHPGEHGNVPVFAPPILRHGDLVLHQTPNILLYLGQRLGLAPAVGDDVDGAGVYRVNALALTALDGLSNEVHDCHHPVATGLYYEDQMPEALRRSRDFVASRLPKFLGYFERVLGGAGAGGDGGEGGPWLYGGQLTYADLVLFQCVDGTRHQFPRAVARLEAGGGFARVFALCRAVAERPRVRAYLDSDRRRPYADGIYRRYEELDVVE